MRVRVVAVAMVVGVGGSIAAPAQAQSDFYESLECVSTGSIQACSSFQITTSSDGMGGTLVSMAVQNRDMDMGYQQLLVSIGLVAPALEGVAYDPDHITTSGAYVVPEGSLEQLRDAWQYTEYQQPGGKTVLEFGVTGTTKDDGTGNTNAAIAGCHLTSEVKVGAFVTCDDTNGDGVGTNTGWVVFNFSTSNRWYASQAEFSYRYKSVGPNDDSLTCPSGDMTCSTQVVPEPLTMILLGSGLAGVGAAARRRRKGLEIETE